MGSVSGVFERSSRIVLLCGGPRCIRVGGALSLHFSVNCSMGAVCSSATTIGLNDVWGDSMARALLVEIGAGVEPTFLSFVAHRGTASNVSSLRVGPTGQRARRARRRCASGQGGNRRVDGHAAAITAHADNGVIGRVGADGAPCAWGRKSEQAEASRAKMPPLELALPAALDEGATRRHRA